MLLAMPHERKSAISATYVVWLEVVEELTSQLVDVQSVKSVTAGAQVEVAPVCAAVSDFAHVFSTRTRSATPPLATVTLPVTLVDHGYQRMLMVCLPNGQRWCAGAPLQLRRLLRLAVFGVDNCLYCFHVAQMFHATHANIEVTTFFAAITVFHVLLQAAPPFATIAVPVPRLVASLNGMGMRDQWPTALKT